jgi:signal transduction histidine kinase
MTRRLVVTYFTITAFALAALAIPLGITFAHREKDRLLFAIERDADAMAASAQGAVTRRETPASDAVLNYAARTGGRVVVVDEGGRSLLDTDDPSGPARDYSNRPEVMHALAGERVDGIRRSETLGTDLIYSAVPVTGADGGVAGAVRITYPSAALDARVRHTWSRIALLCVFVLTVVMSVGWLLARGVTRPVRELEDATERFGRGDLGARVPDDHGPPELRHLAHAFNRMAAEIERLLDAQQQFVADASHQLRTPLTALRLRLENLDARLAPSEHSAIAMVIADVARLSRIVDGLLVLARDDAAGLATEEIDLAGAARSRGDAWREVATEHDVALVVAAAPGSRATVTPGAAEQLIDNLVDNALTVSRPGDTIEIRVARAGERVELHVVDQGPGLTLEARERAFDRFWRAPDAAAGGSGLGLAIVRRLAESSGGGARLDATPGGGIDAVVTLPAARGESGTARVRDSDVARSGIGGA